MKICKWTLMVNYILLHVYLALIWICINFLHLILMWCSAKLLIIKKNNNSLITRSLRDIGEHLLNIKVIWFLQIKGLLLFLFYFVFCLLVIWGHLQRTERINAWNESYTYTDKQNIILGRHYFSDCWWVLFQQLAQNISKL